MSHGRAALRVIDTKRRDVLYLTLCDRGQICQLKSYADTDVGTSVLEQQARS